MPNPIKTRPLYRLVTDETPSLCLAQDEDLKALIAWGKQNNWTPPKYENDPDANCILQRLDLVESEETPK